MGLSVTDGHALSILCIDVVSLIPINKYFHLNILFLQPTNRFPITLSSQLIHPITLNREHSGQSMSFGSPLARLDVHPLNYFAGSSIFSGRYWEGTKKWSTGALNRVLESWRRPLAHHREHNVPSSDLEWPLPINISISQLCQPSSIKTDTSQDLQM